MTEGSAAAKRILVVEDSIIIALDVEECLLDLGADEVVVQATVAGALAALEEPFDFALLDFSLGTDTSEEVAEALRSRGIPFWLATGYGEMAEQLAALGAEGVLIKPFGREELVGIMRDFAARDSASG